MTFETFAHKRCTKCGKDQALAEFGRNAGAADGLNWWCKDCTNTQKRPSTPERMARNRANHRARAALAERHRDEFQQLVAVEYDRALAEIQDLTQPGAEHVTRLRPGARREGQSVAERVDVAWCKTCHAYHDSGHACPSCKAREKRQARLFEANADIMRDRQRAASERRAG